MRRWLRRLAWFCGVAVALLATASLFFWLYFPRSSPAPTTNLSRSADQLARGQYLLEHVTFCLDCHSKRDWGFYGGPVQEGTRGRGAQLEIFGALGRKTYAANITPFGIGNWSDGEVVRAMTSGINAEGGVVNPFMPFDTYRKMSRDDAEALVAYLRMLPAIEHELPPSSLPLALRVIARTLPQPWEPQPAPNRDDSSAYGRYLVEIAECGFCHGEDFSGGQEFELPAGGVVRSANLTPHATGQGQRSRDEFIGLFRAFADPERARIPVRAGEPNTIMPWLRYAGMTTEDLSAIWDYLQTLEAVENPVETWP